MIKLDASGLSCPMPLLKAKQALNGMHSGEQLQIVATDQASWRDFQSFTELSGHQLVSREKSEGVYTFVIQKK
jgi:tRNA 2-thiouridine synthesizing protein A